MQVGTKYDQFTAFTRDEQEEVTRQVTQVSVHCTEELICLSLLIHTVTKIRQGNESSAHLLLHFALHQCAKDIQDCSSQSMNNSSCLPSECF